MDKVIDPANAPKGATPDLMLFDCEACHQGVVLPPRDVLAATKVPHPGSLRFYVANAAMLRVVAARVAPSAAAALTAHMEALDQALGEDWSAVQREARELRSIAAGLVPVLVAHDFTPDDVQTMATGVAAAVLTGDSVEYGVAEQATMALEACIAALRSQEDLPEAVVPAIDRSMAEIYQALGNGDAYRPRAFINAVGDLRKSIAP